MFWLTPTPVNEKNYLDKLDKEISKDDEVSKTRNELLKTLWWSTFWNKFTHGISQWKLSDETLKIISNHIDEFDRLLLFKELCKLDSDFWIFIKMKLRKIQSALATNINASWVFSDDKIRKSIENILSVLEPEPKNKKEEITSTKIKQPVIVRKAAKFNWNQRSRKNTKA